MSVARRPASPQWLLLTFTLPAKRASQRVEVWRKLQRYGGVPLGNSGYLLPNNAANRERFEWLAQSVRKCAGEASIVNVQSIDNLSTAQLIARFSAARARDYGELIQELQRAASIAPHQRAAGRIRRLKGQFREIVEIDFFNSPMQKRVRELLSRIDAPSITGRASTKVTNRRDFLGKLWVTRPRPGIDRSASAWFIRGFVDKNARFAFASDKDVPSGAVPFDMFQGGFGHSGDDCTFETLRKQFRIRDAGVVAVGEMIHDADLGDGKFGHNEALGVDEVLKGWAKKGVPDKELLERGMEMIDGLYHSVSAMRGASKRKNSSSSDLSLLRKRKD